MRESECQGEGKTNLIQFQFNWRKVTQTPTFVFFKRFMLYFHIYVISKLITTPAYTRTFPISIQLMQGSGWLWGKAKRGSRCWRCKSLLNWWNLHILVHAPIHFVSGTSTFVSLRIAISLVKRTSVWIMDCTSHLKWPSVALALRCV